MVQSNGMEIIGIIIKHPIIASKVAGAILGSSIAVAFQPKGDSYYRLLVRFLIGAICGVIFSPILLDVVTDRPHPWDYWLASATFCGAIAIIVLQIIFSRRTYEALQRSIPGAKNGSDADS